MRNSLRDLGQDEFLPRIGDHTGSLRQHDTRNDAADESSRNSQVYQNRHVAICRILINEALKKRALSKLAVKLPYLFGCPFVLQISRRKAGVTNPKRTFLVGQHLLTTCIPRSTCMAKFWRGRHMRTEGSICKSMPSSS